MGRLDQGVYLYPSNVIWLAPVPIWLYRNNTYRLHLRIEQDPLKLWPFREMCSQDVLDFIRTKHGWTEEQLPPFLVQMRALWHKSARDGGWPSIYENYFGAIPPNPEWDFGTGHFLDKWRSSGRAFRVGLVITIGDHPAITIPMHSGLNAVVSHTGDNTPTTSNVPLYPKHDVFAYSQRWGVASGVRLEDRELGYYRQEFSGPGYTVTVVTDGYCITTVDVESEGREIRVGWHVEQDSLRCPQGMGVSIGTTAEYWAPPPGGGPNTRLFTSYNDLPWSNVSVSSSGVNSGLGSFRATRFMYAGVRFARSTIFSTGGTYSLDSDAYDWTDCGAPGGPEYACSLTSGESYDTVTDESDLSVEEWFSGRTQSMALAGAGIIPYRDSEWQEMEPFATASDLHESDADSSFQEAVENWRKWDNEAKARWLQFGPAQHATPPQIKISGTFEIVNITGEQPFAMYAPMPFTYEHESFRAGFGDIYDVEAIATAYSDGGFTHEVHDYKSDDRFSYAMILMCKLNGELKLGRDGLSANWLESLDGFDGESTIAEDKFAPGPNTYIYDDRTPQTFQAWYADDAF